MTKRKIWFLYIIGITSLLPTQSSQIEYDFRSLSDTFQSSVDSYGDDDEPPAEMILISNNEQTTKALVKSSKKQTEKFEMRTGADENEYSYSKNSRIGPQNWDQIFEECGGNRQSPVALDESVCNVAINAHAPIIGLPSSDPKTYILANDGRDVMILFTWPNNNRPYLIGDQLNGRFIFDHFRFHVGAQNSKGSEHKVNSKYYAMELHLVFYNELYNELSKAAFESDGLAIIAVLFTASKTAPNYGILNNITFIERPNTQKQFKFIGGQIVNFPKLFQSGFYTYEGSFTSPRCFETVSWFIDARVQEISYYQLEKLRSLIVQNENHNGNLRPLQPLNDRTCTFYQ